MGVPWLRLHRILRARLRKRARPSRGGSRHRRPFGRRAMSRLRVACFGISLDGFGAGPDQGLKNPLGVGGMALHEWVFPTRSFKEMHGEGGGATGIDDDFAARGVEGIGAWILGRNMFGPVRGPWPDESWKGWWGDEPPYHVPVFVLTHHARAPD